MVKFTLGQATKAQCGEMYNSTLPLTSALDGGWMVSTTPRLLYHPGKDPVPTV